MTPPAANVATQPTRRSRLAEVNATLIRFRRALAHDHGDAPFWAAFGMTAAQAQRTRLGLRDLATDLHHGARS